MPEPAFWPKADFFSLQKNLYRLIHNYITRNRLPHRLPLEKTGLGFKLVAEAKESIKVLINP